MPTPIHPRSYPGSRLLCRGRLGALQHDRQPRHREGLRQQHRRQQLRPLQGPGTFTGHSLRGHLHESRISVLGPSGVVSRHLNKHINYDTCCSAIPNSVNARSLSQPVDMAITGDGATLYVAAFGSSKIGVFQTAQLENNSFVPGTANQINVSGGGPSGLALDESNHRLYVLTRFDNAISVVDTRTGVEQRHLAMNNPEPASVTRGRRFLYDAPYTSSNGESACGSCHVFGDFDSLAWNLGNPDGDALANPSRLREFPGIPNGDPQFRPLKGPMVTQSLRGMDNHGPMHWRGDRTGVNDEATAQPNSGQFNETLAFSKFNPLSRACSAAAPRCPHPRWRPSVTSFCRPPTRRTRSAISTTR